MIEFNEQDYWQPTELADKLKISRRALMRLVKLNLIGFTQVSARKFYFSGENVRKFLEGEK